MLQENQQDPLEIPNTLLKKPKIYNKDVIGQKHDFLQSGGNEFIQVVPNIAKFTGFEINKLNILKLKIVNQAPIAQRIHVLPSKKENNVFTVKMIKKGLLASGMNEDLYIHFRPQEYRYYYDTIRINSETCDILVPIHAYPVPNRQELRELFPKIIDFGTVEIGQSQLLRHQLKCKIPLNYEFEFVFMNKQQNNQDVQIVPQEGKIPGNGHIDIDLVYTPSNNTTIIVDVELRLSQFDYEPLEIKLIGNGRYPNPQELKKKSTRKLDPLTRTQQPQLQYDQQQQEQQQYKTLMRPGSKRQFQQSQQQQDAKSQLNESKQSMRLRNSIQKSQQIYQQQQQILQQQQLDQLSSTQQMQQQQEEAMYMQDDQTIQQQWQQYDRNDLQRQNEEKLFIDKFNNVRLLDKNKEIKFFQCIGDELINQETVENINQERDTFQERRLEDLEQKGIHRYDLQLDQDAPIIEQVVPSFDCQWDFDKNDPMKRRFLIQKRLTTLGSKVILKNRKEERLQKIKNFLGSARTKEDVQKLVNLDHQKAEYTGIGKKDFIQFNFEFEEHNIEKYLFPIQYESSNNFSNFKFEINPRTGFDDWSQIEPIDHCDAEVMDYRNQDMPQIVLYPPIETHRKNRTGAEEEYYSLGKLGQHENVLQQISEPLPKSFQKPFDIETFRLLLPHLTIRQYKNYFEVTEVDPEYYLQHEIIPTQDEFDPNPQNEDINILSYEFLRKTPGLNSIHAIQNLPIEHITYDNKRLELPKDYGYEAQLDKYCPSILPGIEYDDNLTDDDSDGEQPPQIPVEDKNDFLNEIEDKDDIITNIREKNQKEILDQYEQVENTLNNKIENEKQKQISHIPSKSTNDWNKRLEALIKLQGYIKGNAKYNELFLQQYLKLTPQINTQLKDLRSAISKEATKLICLSSEEMKTNYEQIAIRYMNKESLLSTISSGNKVIAENGNKCILALIDNVQSEKFINSVTEEMSSKNKNLRDKLSQYIIQIISIYDIQKLIKYQKNIDQLFINGMKDANQEVRANIREAFCIYSQYFPQKTDKMKQDFDQQTIRALQESIQEFGHIYQEIAENNSSFQDYQQNKGSNQQMSQSSLLQSKSNIRSSVQSQYSQKLLSSNTVVIGNGSNNSNNNTAQKKNGQQKSHAQTTILPKNKQQLQQQPSSKKLPPRQQQKQLTVEGRKKQQSQYLDDKEQFSPNPLKSQKNNSLFQEPSNKSQSDQQQYDNGDDNDQDVYEQLNDSQDYDDQDQDQEEDYDQQEDYSDEQEQEYIQQQKQYQQHQIRKQQTQQPNKNNSRYNIIPQQKQQNQQYPQQQQQQQQQQKQIQNKNNKSKSKSTIINNFVEQKRSFNSQKNTSTSSLENSNHKNNYNNIQQQKQPTKQLRNIPNNNNTNARSNSSYKLQSNNNISNYNGNGKINGNSNNNIIRASSQSHSKQNSQQSIPSQKNIILSSQNGQKQQQQQPRARSQKHPSSSQQQQSYIRSHNSSLQQQYNNNSKDEDDNDLEFLIEKANNKNWASRQQSFEKIQAIFEQQLDILDNLPMDLIKSLIELHINKLNDSHFKVVSACSSSLILFLQAKSQMIFPFLDQILPKLLVNLTDQKEQVSSKANLLVNLLQKLYQSDELINPILKYLESTPKQVVKICALEVLSLLFKEANYYFNQVSNVRHAINQIGYLIMDNYNVKGIFMPCLCLLLAMRDQNRQATLHCLLSLPSQNQVASIRLLACQYAGDLEEDLRQYSVNPQQFQQQSQQQQPQLQQSAQRISHQRPQKNSISKQYQPQQQQQQHQYNNYIDQQEMNHSNNYNNNNDNTREEEISDIEELEEVINNYEQNQPVIVQNMNEIIKTLCLNIENLSIDGQERVLDILNKLFSHQLIYTNISPNSVELCLDLYHKVPKNIDVYTLDEIIEKILDCIPPMTSLKALVEKISIEIPPFLQIMIKKISYVIQQAKQSEVSPFLDHMVDIFKQQINDESPDVRKSIVFCIVDLHFLFGQELDAYLQMFTLNQQKLVAIYIQRRLDSKQSISSSQQQQSEYSNQQLQSNIIYSQQQSNYNLNKQQQQVNGVSSSIQYM